MSILTIQLYPRESECIVCGTFLCGPPYYGVPRYEGLVLPNDWEGEWGGFDACQRCYEAQQHLLVPMDTDEFLQFRASFCDDEPPVFLDPLTLGGLP